MSDLALAQEPVLRLGSFVIVLAACLLAEARFARRPRHQTRRRRWSVNGGLVLIDTLVLRLILPVMPVALALAMTDRGWGLFPLLGLSGWPAFLLALVLLDLVIWAQHRIMHRWPPLWRLHRIHHTDLEVDSSTALRFHPLEILLSAGVKLAAVAVLGPPAAAVLTFEVLLNAAALFNHANLALPQAWDRRLRWGIVTPDMHRIHHSLHPEETDSNFGFFLPWWDRLFGTYTAAPRDGQATMALGLAEDRDPAALGLVSLILRPFGPARGPAPPRSRPDTG